MKKFGKNITILFLGILLFAASGCKQNSDDGDEYIAPVTKTVTVTNTINGVKYVETITMLLYKNIYSFEKRTGVAYNKNYEIDVTESVLAYYSGIARTMKNDGYVIAEANSTGTKNGTAFSTTNCYRRDGNKYYMNSHIYYR